MRAHQHETTAEGWLTGGQARALAERLTESQYIPVTMHGHSIDGQPISHLGGGMAVTSPDIAVIRARFDNVPAGTWETFSFRFCGGNVRCLVDESRRPLTGPLEWVAAEIPVENHEPY